MKNRALRQYKILLAKMKEANYYNIFPYYDTEDVADLEKLINKMSNEEYNKEPVTACKHCKSLYIVKDELDNDVCFRCGSVNDTVTFDNIDEYQRSIDTKNE